MKKYLVLLIILITPAMSLGDTFEFMAGTSYEKFDDYSDYDSFSFSTRIRYTRYRSGSSFKHGFFVDGEFPGISLVTGNIMGGYGLRTQGRLFCEIGAGVSYGTIWGMSVAGIGSLGARLGNRWGVSVSAKVTTLFIDVLPLIVYNF